MKTTDLKKIIDLFSPINDAISIIEKVATLEQAENEAKQRIDKLRKEAAKIEADNIKAESEAGAIMATAQEKANGLGVAANTELANAKAKAEAILAEARAQAKTLTAAADEKVKKLQDQADAALAAVKERNAELADLEAKIEKAKAQIAKMLK